MMIAINKGSKTIYANKGFGKRINVYVCDKAILDAFPTTANIVYNIRKMLYISSCKTKTFTGDDAISSAKAYVKTL